MSLRGNRVCFRSLVSGKAVKALKGKALRDTGRGQWEGGERRGPGGRKRRGSVDQLEIPEVGFLREIIMIRSAEIRAIDLDPTALLQLLE